MGYPCFVPYRSSLRSGIQLPRSFQPTFIYHIYVLMLNYTAYAYGNVKCDLGSGTQKIKNYNIHIPAAGHSPLQPRSPSHRHGCDCAGFRTARYNTVASHPALAGPSVSLPKHFTYYCMPQVRPAQTTVYLKAFQGRAH